MHDANDAYDGLVTYTAIVIGTVILIITIPVTRADYQ